MKKHKLYPKKNIFNIGSKTVLFLLFIMIVGNIFKIGYDSYETYLLNQNKNNSELPKFMLIKQLLKDHYLFSNDLTEEEIMEGAISGMVESLKDPYAMYISDNDYKNFKVETEGSFGGIGVSVDSSDVSEGLVVSNTENGLGASIAGIKANDKIIAVNGEDIKGKNIDDSINKIRGEIGTSVTLMIEREGEESPIELVVERKQVELTYVSYELLDDKIGYLYYKKFSNISLDQFDEAYNELKEQGMEYLILDLRDNPGGLVNIAIDLASRFLGQNKTVLYVEGKNYKLEHQTGKTDYLIDVPVVVLVNNYSASASEILAGALQDHKKAYIIGDTTYGKGLIQETIPVSNSSALIMTISQYLTPNGNIINEIGVEPNKFSHFSAEAYLEGKDNVLEDAIHYINNLKGE